MNLNKFLRKNIFKQLIIFYIVSLLLFTILRFFDFYRETNRFYLLTKNYIQSSTEQLINEGDILRLQMNIDQFLGINNKENLQIICPRVFLNSRLIASVECNGLWTYSKSAQITLSNGQKLEIDFRMDGTHFLYNNFILFVTFTLILTFVFVIVKKAIDSFSIQITQPLLRWSEWAKNLNLKKQFDTPQFSQEDLKITEFDNFNKFNQKAFEIQKEIFEAHLTEERAKIELALAKSVSHDIRSPLTALKNMNNDISFQSKESEVLFSETLSRIEFIANDLLKKSLAKKDNGSFSSQLNSLLQEKLLQFKDKNIFINNQIQESNFSFFPNINQKLLRVISNLLNNAIEAQMNFDKISLDIKLTIKDHQLRVDIIDEGPGIPTELQQVIGKKSVSQKQSQNQGQSGSGIGLLSAYEFLANHNGKISFVSNQNGTHFTIWFPLIPEEIILIDDDKITHLAWSKEAQKKSIQLHSFFSADECLLNIDRFPRNTFIFIDNHLGLKSGPELAAQLHKLGFSHLYLQTGEIEIDKPDSILDVLSKDFPFQ